MPCVFFSFVLWAIESVGGALEKSFVLFLECRRFSCRLYVDCKIPSLFSKVIWGTRIGFRKCCVGRCCCFRKSLFFLVIAVLSLGTFRFH